MTERETAMNGDDWMFVEKLEALLPHGTRGGFSPVSRGIIDLPDDAPDWMPGEDYTGELMGWVGDPPVLQTMVTTVHPLDAYIPSLSHWAAPVLLKEVRRLRAVLEEKGGAL